MNHSTLHPPIQASEADYVSTGHLPPADLLERLVAEAYERFRFIDEGELSTVSPALAAVPRNLFGICVVGTSGIAWSAGDADRAFAIMSVSKPFVFALVCDVLGAE